MLLHKIHASKALYEIFAYFIFFLLVLFLQALTANAYDVIAITTRSSSATGQILEGIRSVCGNTIAIKEYDMKGSSAEGKKIVKKIKKILKSEVPKIIFTLGAPATKLAKEAKIEVPVMYCMVVNPEKKGFIGKNISGIAMNVPIKTQLNQLKLIAPKALNVGIIYDPQNTDNIIEEARQAASELSLNLVPYEVLSPKEVPRAIRGIINRINALLIVTDNTVINKYSLEFIVTATLENKIPTVVYTPYLVKAGFLFSLSPDHASLGKQVGGILCNAANAKNEIEPVMRFPEILKFTINMKTARRIGLTMPPGIANSADEVFN